MPLTDDEIRAPVRINWFNDRVEIQNSGGPFAMVNRRNVGDGARPTIATAASRRP